MMGLEEFFQAGPEENAAQRRMFDLQPMGRELDALVLQRPPMMQQDGNWGAEFAQMPDLGHLLEHGPQQQLGNSADASWATDFTRMQTEPFRESQGNVSNWVSDFRNQQSLLPELQKTVASDMVLQNAFEQAKQQATWDAEFARTQDPASWASEFSKAQAESWINEFKEQEGIAVNAGDSKEALAETAGLLLDAVAGSANPKFRDSKFLGFMQQLRDQELSIEGNKVVEQTTPIAAAQDWAKEFGTTVNQGSWEEDFSAQQDPMGSIASPKLWAEEFGSQAESGWAQEYQGNGPPLEDKHWTNEFERQQAEALAQASRAMSQEQTPLEDQSDQAMADLYKDAWDYDNMDFSEFAAGRAVGARYEHYEFTSTNPYIGRGAPLSVRNLTEGILVLEAEVQQDPTNAKAWYELGIRQQENENDVGAIAALRQAVRHDPGLTDSWIALAVSFTNESAREDAYDALESWITNSERYASIPRMAPTAQNRHEQISDMFISAARMAAGQDLDADVQVGLGVLFNISEEYLKAVDCFEAALSIRPHDYLLWNKLGATLANSNNSDRAIESYFQALEINPSYVRARYNLAISCIQLGQYREAAEHLLGALSVQVNNINTVMAETKGKGPADQGDLDAMHTVQSSTVWATLKMVADGHLRRHDLADACEKRDLDAFRGEFDF
ncbi:Peroxisomal membrane signal receptor PTS1 [Thoreauomyces humboldtii]|nr:Peroxisomal membrane signal receptor PTS1 [Thoreauomyces humboldtii]